MISEKAKSVEMKTENEEESDAEGISMEGREWKYFSFLFAFYFLVEAVVAFFDS